MSAIFDASSSANGAIATTASWSHTCTGSNRVLHVGISLDGAGVADTTATYAGVSMLKLAELSAQQGLVHFRLVNPATGANTIQLNWSGSFVWAGAALSFTNVDQSTPDNATPVTGEIATGTSLTHDVTSEVGDIVVDVMSLNAGSAAGTTLGAGQTGVESEAAAAATLCGMSWEPGATTTTMSWSWTTGTNRNAHSAININGIGPVFVQEAETVWNTTTSPKTTASFNVVAGDLLVAFGITQNNNATIPTIAGGSLTWTERQHINFAGWARTYIWTAVVDVDKAMTVTFTAGGSVGMFGGNVETWRNHGGVGVSAQATAAGAAASVNITTTSIGSAIVVTIGDGDNNAVDGVGRVWRTNAGPFTEQTYFRDPAAYVVYGGHHLNAGAVGTYAVGITTPLTDYAIAALEVKSITASAALEQYGYRFRNDDGSETTATWKAAQNTTATIAEDETFRLRFGINASADTASKRHKLQYRKVGDASWRDIDTSG